MRLFVAVPLPDETRAALAVWMKRCGAQPALRWTKEEQLHITLHFLGEVEDVRSALVTAALDGLRRPTFDVEIDRLEVLGRADVLAAAAKLTPELAALEIEVRARVAKIPGLKSETLRQAQGRLLGARERTETREFRPHVTMARAPRGERVPRASAFAVLTKIDFRAECFRLYRSELRRDGAVHTIVREWKLT